MAVEDPVGELIKFLPPTLDVANGDSFSLTWIDGEEIDQSEPEPPFGTITHIATTPDEIFPFDHGNDPVTQQTSDTITFQSGTDIYELTEKDAVDDSSSISATVNGSSTTLEEGTDYELVDTVDEFIDEGNFLDSVEFLDGGTKPDDGTNFTITYDEWRSKRVAIVYERQTYHLALKAQRSLSSNNASATIDYPKSRLAKQLGESLLEDLFLKHGDHIGSTEGMRLHGFQPVGQMSTREGSSTSIWAVDIEITNRRTMSPGDLHRYIGSPKVTIDPSK